VTRSNSNTRVPGSRNVIVVIVGFTLFMIMWGVRQFNCPERASLNVEVAPQSIRIVVLEGICYFSEKSNASVNVPDLKQELVIEEGREYELNVESHDYVYSLRQLELSLNVVAVPGLVSTLSFQTEQPGNYEIKLAPMCGFPWKHQDSPGIIVVEKRRKGRCD